MESIIQTIQTEPVIDYKRSAELLKEIASSEFRDRMTSQFILLGNSRLKFNNYISNYQTESLKIDKYIGLIRADDPQLQLSTFSSRKNKGFSLYQQPLKPLESRFIPQEEYEPTARLFDITPDYLLKILGKYN